MNYSDETINILRLIRTKGIGLKTFEYLNKSFSNITCALNYVKSILKKELVSSEQITNELTMLYKKFNGKILTFKDKQYPTTLKNMNDFPPAISYIGNLNLLNDKNIAIVGARKSSLPFLYFTEKLANNLVKCKGINIVSGLAFGVDTYAHKGAIYDNSSRTIVVLPHGIDHSVYPINNLKLYQNIIRNGGLILSEFPLFAPPGPMSFHQRNRIIAGLSLGIIVIQASINSGSLITAKYGLDYNRQIFAVPGAPMSALSEGTNHLINQGAQIITSVSDTSAIIHNLTLLNNLDNSNNSNNFNTMSLKDDTFQDKIVVLNDHKTKILNLLSHDYPVTVETIAQHLHLSIQIVRVALVELSLQGNIIINDNDSVLLINI